MNTPQLENGYLRIANELAENFAKIKLSPNEWRICWAFLRKTYGFNKKEDAISLTQFQKLTNLSRPSVVKAIKKLVAKQILVAKQQPFIHVYRLNKAYSQWTSSYIDTSSYFATTLVAKQQPKLVAKQQPTIDKKDNIQKTVETASRLSPKIILYKRKPVEQQTPQLRICYFYEDCLGTSIVNWAKEITAVSKMLKAGYTEKQITLVIKQMKEEEYYQDKFFDLMTVANQIPKYKAKAQKYKRKEENVSEQSI